MSTQTQQARPLDVAVIDRRFLAVVIDSFVLGLPLFFLFSPLLPNLSLVTPVALGGTLWWLLRPIYYIALEGYGGQTLGKRIVGIKVVSESTGQVAGFKAAIKRNLPRLVLSGFILLVWVLGLVSPSGLSEGSFGYHLDAYDRLTSIVWAHISIVDYLRYAGDDFEDVVLWVTGIVGLIAMRVTGKTQRLGDMAAHTLVVRK